eukprot:scaffold2319_cov350-Pavlova_lutheri.AAC.14
MDEREEEAGGRGLMDAAVRPVLKEQFGNDRARKGICVWKSVELPNLNEEVLKNLDQEIESGGRSEERVKACTSTLASPLPVEDHHPAMRVETYEKLKRKAFGILRKAQVDKNYLDAYGGKGWRRKNANRFVPETEIRRAEQRLEEYKASVRGIVRLCDEAEGAKRMAALALNSSGENAIDVEEISCSFCGDGDSWRGNDIIICDGYCERAYHQKCIEPAVCLESMAEDQGWLCPPCRAKVDIVFKVDDVFGVQYDATTPWHVMFRQEHEGEEGEEQQGTILGVDLPSEDEEDEDFQSGNETETSGRSDVSLSEEVSDGQDGSVIDAMSGEQETSSQEGSKEKADFAGRNTGKRKRSKVDYQALAESMFGWGEAYAGEGLDSEDEAWHPGDEAGKSKALNRSARKEGGAKARKENRKTRKNAAERGESSTPGKVGRKRR